MSDSEATDDLEAIRERKRRELEAKLRRGELGEESDAAGDAATPTDPIHFDGGSLEATVGEYDLALVDFYADWCGPCQMLAPVLDRIAADTDAAVVKVDADVHQHVCQSYGVQGLPTLVLFQSGEPVERLVGAKSEGELRNLIERRG